MADVVRLEMHLGDHAEVRLQRKFALKHPREKSSRDFVGKGVATTSGSFCWRALL
jgi:hypothetical protein